MTAPSSRVTLFPTALDYPYFLPAAKRHSDNIDCSKWRTCARSRRRAFVDELIRLSILIRVGSSDGCLPARILHRSLFDLEFQRDTSSWIFEQHFYEFFCNNLKTTRSDRSPLSFERGIAELEGRHACLRSRTTACSFFGFSRFPKPPGALIVTVLRYLLDDDLLRYAPLGIL